MKSTAVALLALLALAVVVPFARATGPCDFDADPTPCQPIVGWARAQAQPYVDEATVLEHDAVEESMLLVAEWKAWPGSCTYHPDTGTFSCNTLPRP